MTIKELIEKLQHFDPDAKVTLEKIDDLYNDVVDVYQDYDGTVIITEIEG